MIDDGRNKQERNHLQASVPIEESEPRLGIVANDESEPRLLRRITPLARDKLEESAIERESNHLPTLRE